MKITGQTTLAEAAVERARLGITELHIIIGKDGNRVVSAVSPTGGAQCSAPTEAEALDKVFRRIEAGVWLNEQTNAPGEGTPVGFYEVQHNTRSTKYFDQLLGFCCCEFCSKLPEHAPLPPGEYKVKAEGDPLEARAAVITDGEHAGETVHIPGPKIKDLEDAQRAAFKALREYEQTVIEVKFTDPMGRDNWLYEREKKADPEYRRLYKIFDEARAACSKARKL